MIERKSFHQVCVLVRSYILYIAESPRAFPESGFTPVEKYIRDKMTILAEMHKTRLAHLVDSFLVASSNSYNLSLNLLEVMNIAWSDRQLSWCEVISLFILVGELARKIEREVRDVTVVV